MPLMSAELSDAQPLGGVLPEGEYVCQMQNAAKSASGIDKTKEGDGDMVVIRFVVAEGEYANRRVFPPHYVLVGGTKADGTKHDLNRAMELLNASGIQWSCQACGFVGGNGVPLEYNKADRKYYCSGCHKQSPIQYNTDDYFDGVRRVRVRLNQQKGLQGDDMVNGVTRVRAIN